MTFNIHLYPSFITNESRIFKESKSLIESNIVDQIHIIGIWKEGLKKEENLAPGIKIVRMPISWYTKVPIFKSSLYYLEWCLRIYKKYRLEKIDVIQCHSLFGLLFSILLKKIKRAYLIYDTHELATEINGLQGIRKKIRKIKERLLISFPDRVIVVSDGILQWYRRKYPKIDVQLIKNIPNKTEVTVSKKSILKERFKIGNEITFIYQGSFSSGRGIELLLNIFSTVADKHIIFMGYGALEEKIKLFSSEYANIHFHPAVNSSEIIDYTSGVDVGLSVIENTCLSYYHCLPNKLYEYTQAGIAVIFSNFPDMKEEMEKYDNGWETAVEYKKLKDLIINVTEQEVVIKKNNAFKSKHLIDWNTQGKLLVAMYKSLIKSNN